MKLLARLFFLGLAVAALPASARETAVQSPAGRAAAVFDDSNGVIRWRATLNSKVLLAPAAIGLDLAGPAAIKWHLGAPTVSEHASVVTGLIGRASSARDHYREIVMTAGRAPGLRFDLIARAYDDALAYRWRITSTAPLTVAAEFGSLGPPPATTLWALPVSSFTSSYEGFYRTGSLTELAHGQRLFALPTLLHVPAAGWAAFTEAALDDWAGLYLAPGGDGRLGYRLSPLPQDTGVAVRRPAGVNLSPWRVALVASEPGRLLESNVINLLNPPPMAGDWSWVKPGKTLFPWWNDYYWPGARFTPGLNTATYLALIDFAGANGIPYVTLDGYQDEAWYGGPIAPDGTFQDLTRARREIDMPALLARARERGVRLRLWVHWKPLSEQLERALDAWHRWGIEGVMVDFMDRDDQQMVAFYHDVARKAAARQMTVTFHGAYKPTGEIRTWPNVLTREASRNAEYNKFANQLPHNPDHEATAVFVRMLAGPLDTHQGGFNNVTAKAFRTRTTNPLIIGTRARALALYIVEENPLPMLADSPVNYRGSAGFDFAVSVPATWDETRVLFADAGHSLVIARRRARDWWIGAITDHSARTITVPLGALGSGRFAMQEWRDIEGAQPSHVRNGQKVVSGTNQLEIRMSPAGGFAARLAPIH